MSGVGPAGGEFGRITRIVLKPVDAAFIDQSSIDGQWRDLNFTAAPDFARARAEYSALRALLTSAGAEVLELPPDPATTLDSIYVRDAALVSPNGIILCNMGKPQRVTEPDAQRRAYAAWNLPVAGAVQPPGRIEGGDVVWLDERTLAVGRGYRTNDQGIRQLSDLLGPDIDVIVVPLPHWRGPADVFHLMSILSPVDRDLAVVYSPLMPVPFREFLADRGVQFVEVPEEEFDSMGANVLAIAPRHCVMVDGNPRTQARLEQAGATVHTYSGREISLKGGGGPTCLTRPLVRAYTGAL